MRLPLVTEPATQETLHSYLTRCAERHAVTTAAIAQHLGLRSGKHWVSHYGIVIRDEHAAVAAAILGITTSQLRGMHLSFYDGTALDLSALTDTPGMGGVRQTTQRNWAFLAGTRFCPRCLRADGVWRLQWRLPWIVVCQQHQVWLETTCTMCGGTPGLYSAQHASAPNRASARPNGRRCDLPHPHHSAAACGADLSAQTTTPANGQQLSLALEFDCLFEQRAGRFAGQPLRSLEVLRGWQAAIGFVARYRIESTHGWGRTHRWGTPPRPATTMGALMHAVAPLAHAPTTAAAADVLLGWCAQAEITAPHYDTFRRVTQPSALDPVITAAMNRVGRMSTLVSRHGMRQRETLPVLAWSIDDVPQVAWPCALPQELRHNTRPHYLILRTVVSMMLIRMATRATWHQAAVLLGLPGTTAQWGRYVGSVAFIDIRTSLLQRVRAVADALPHQPTSAWVQRPTSTDPAGYGILQLAGTQRPDCAKQSRSGWCPCTTEPGDPNT